MRAPMSRCREHIMPSRTALRVNYSREPFRTGKPGAKLWYLKRVFRRAGSFSGSKQVAGEIPTWPSAQSSRLSLHTAQT